MTYFPEFPDFSSPPTDALPRPVPAGGGRTGPAQEAPDVSVVGEDVDFRAYIVESLVPTGSSAPGADCWELRPFYTHRGGRAWNRHASRVFAIPGLFMNQGLAFADPRVAMRCAASLRQSRSDRSEFRVLEVRIRQEFRVLDSVEPGWRAPETVAAREASLGPSAPSRTSLSRPVTGGEMRRAGEEVPGAAAAEKFSAGPRIVVL